MYQRRYKNVYINPSDARSAYALLADEARHKIMVGLRKHFKGVQHAFRMPRQTAQEKLAIDMRMKNRLVFQHEIPYGYSPPVSL